MSTIAIKVFPTRGRRAGVSEVTCQPFASRGANPWAADVLSIARAGFRLGTGRRFEPGTVLLVRVKEPGDCEYHQLPARVFHVMGPVEGNWIIDCEVASECDDDFLMALRRSRSGNSEPAAAN